MARTRLLLLLLLCPLFAHATACPTGYSYSKVFYIDTNQFSTTLTSFPVLLPFNGVTTPTTGLSGSAPNDYVLNDLKVTGSGGKVQSSTGLDIIFCDAYSGGNLLPFEREVYTSTTGAAEFWVSRTLTSATQIPIWMFYGKSGASDLSSAASVWSAANYTFVQHYGNGSSLSITDSTGNSTPTNHGSTSITGFVGGGVNMASASSQNINSGYSLTLPSGMTLEGWINPSSANISSGIERGMIMSFTNSNLTGFELGTGNGGSGIIEFAICADSSCGTNSLLISFTNALTTGWQHMQATASSTATGLAVYVNGTLFTNWRASNTGAGSIPTSPNPIQIGGDGVGSSRFWDGGLDEIRISNIVQSTDWITANYETQVNASSFAVMADTSIPAGMTSGAYCVPVTVPSSNVSATQGDFPLLVHGTYSWMADTAHGGFAVTGNNGHDIRWFSNSACTTAIAFQRTYWTNTTGDSNWRVHVASLSSSSNTTVYVKIGSVTDTSDQSTLWMAGYNYVGAYLSGSPASVMPTNVVDSGSAASNFVSGDIGANILGAVSLQGGGWFAPAGSVGDDTMGICPLPSGYPVGSAVVHERVWFRPTLASYNVSVPGSWNVVGFGKANTTGQVGVANYMSTKQINPVVTNTITGLATLGGFESGGTVVAATSPSSTSVSSPTFVPDLGWHVVDFDYPTSGGPVSGSSIYIDGVPITSPSLGNPTSALATDGNNQGGASCIAGSSELRLFRDAAHAENFFAGYATDYEVSNVSRSASYAATRFNNEIAPWNFYSFGTAVPVSGGGTVQPVVSIMIGN